jgi:hypothetical protein
MRVWYPMLIGVAMLTAAGLRSTGSVHAQDNHARRGEEVTDGPSAV